jgi:uncharacterized iron-regulated membrane protein
MRNWRKLHGKIALIIFLPLIIIALSGVILQLRDQFEYIQPSLVKYELIKDLPGLTLKQIEDRFPGLDQIIYKPQKQSLLIRYKDGYEKQIHPQTGEVLKEAMRRTNVLIEIHQGSWMGKFGQYFIHFISGLALCFLIMSGLYIYPFKRKKS